MQSLRTLIVKALSVLAAAAVALTPTLTAVAYAPTGGILYQLPDNQPCLKGRGNCAVYPKAVELPSGRLIAAFEKSTVAPSGSAAGQTVPIYTSDDAGTTWQSLTNVKSPAELSTDPAYDKYTSNWTNPYLYVLPQNVGNLTAGTLLLATVVSGDDHYYLEHKAADPNWVPTNDGDRSDLAIALYSSTTEGASWNFVNIVATGGWQGGSAGNIGSAISQANVYAQVDPVWEPYLMVHDNQLVAYYSDENDYIGYNATTGVANLHPQNSTAPDSHAQILVHRTWNGLNTSTWSAPVVDVAGDTLNVNGQTQIGGGRPGMTNVVPTTDGKWMITFEYFGGGANSRFKMGTDPLRFFADNDPNGNEVSLASGQQGLLPYAPGSRGLSWGGSPVVIRMADGRLVYNAGDSGDVWVNATGRSDGVWTQFQTTLGSGYSRNLTYVASTGRVVILQGTWGGPTASAVIRYAEVDLGKSVGAYYRLVNRKTGQVIGTGGNITDATIGNGDVPDVRLETLGSTSQPHTQYWHLATKADGKVTLLNKAGGRAAAIWTGSATAGQRIGQWVDDTPNGLWSLVQTDNGYVRLQSAANTSLYLTGDTAGGFLTLQTSATDGSQEWQLVAEGPTDTTPPTVDATVVGRTMTITASDGGSGVASIQYRTAGTSTWSTYSAPVKYSGRKAVTVEYRATDVAGNISAVRTAQIPAT